MQLLRSIGLIITGGAIAMAFAGGRLGERISLKKSPTVLEIPVSTDAFVNSLPIVIGDYVPNGKNAVEDTLKTDSIPPPLYDFLLHDSLIGYYVVEDTMKYIQGQAEHHRKLTFKGEVEVFLKKHGMEYVERDLE